MSIDTDALNRSLQYAEGSNLHSKLKVLSERCPEYVEELMKSSDNLNFNMMDELIKKTTPPISPLTFSLANTTGKIPIKTLKELVSAELYTQEPAESSKFVLVLGDQVRSVTISGKALRILASVFTVTGRLPEEIAIISEIQSRLLNTIPTLKDDEQLLQTLNDLQRDLGGKYKSAKEVLNLLVAYVKG